MSPFRSLSGSLVLKHTILGHRLHHLALILGVFHLLLCFLPMGRYTSLVIHHTASQTGDYASVQRAHLRKYGGMAYHLILSNGSGRAETGHLEAGWRYVFLWYSRATRSLTCNTRALHLCVVGNFEEQAFPDGLKPALGGAVRAIQRRWGIPDENIMLHRDCSATACPGKNVTTDRIKQWLKRDCPKDLVQQHEAVLGRPFFLGFPLGPALALSPFSLIFSLVWVLAHRRERAGNSL